MALSDELHPDHARRRLSAAADDADVMWQFTSEASPRPTATGYYRDQFAKIQGEWKFARRESYGDQRQ